MIIIETERLILRTWKNTDADKYYQINQDPQVIEFFLGSLSMKEVKDFIIAQNQQFDKLKYTVWAAEEKSSGELMGFIGLNVPNWEAHFTPCVEIGWRLGSQYWGKGYATEGAKAALKYGFETIGLKEIVSFAVPDNIRSIRIMEKIGMKRDLKGDFAHPKLPTDHKLSKHVLYRAYCHPGNPCRDDKRGAELKKTERQIARKFEMTNIENIIGDYQAFFSDLLRRMKELDINISGMPISHLLYRVVTTPEYENLRDQLKTFCSEFVETLFNGRAVSILVLEKPLVLEDGFTVSMIELPAPRPVHMYPSGLESIGVVVGKTLPAFIKKYDSVLTGVKDHGEHCQPAFITFDNDKTSKFYDISLREIVKLQGWKIEKI